VQGKDSLHVPSERSFISECGTNLALVRRRVTKTRPTDGSRTEVSTETPGSLIHRIVARPSFDGSFIVPRNVTNPLDAKWRTN